MGFKENTKKMEGRERKKAQAEKKQQEQLKKEEEEEAKRWEDTKNKVNKAEIERQKRQEREERRKANEEALKREVESVKTSRTEQKRAAKTSVVRNAAAQRIENQETPHYEASNVDDALFIMKPEAKLERHPERRLKAALREFEDRNLERFRKENPSLRLSQLKQIMWKEFKKSEFNPFNNAVAYNATNEELAEVEKKKVDEKLEKMSNSN